MAAGIKSLSKTFVWILLGLLMLGLAGFGAVDLVGSVRAVAHVGDESITVDAYARELQREIRAIEAQTGQPLTMSQAREIGVDQLALSRLIALAALDNEVAQMGVSIGDENLQREILEIPAFQGVDGSFDREAYRFQLEQIGMSEAEFESDLRKETSRTLVQGAVVSGVSMPDTMADTLANYVGARRSFTLATLGADALEAPVPAPTDAEIQSYYDENTDQFYLPLTKRLTYAVLSPDMLQDEVEVDGETLQRLYDQRKAEYQQPERRLVERLVFSDEGSAAAALDQIVAGDNTFEALVEERGLTLQDVDLGDLAADELGAAAEAVFAAEVGDTVGPLRSDLGPALFRVNGALAEQIVTFEEAEAELRSELAADRARRLIEAQSEEINDLLAGGATLEELAVETDLDLGQIDWTDDSDDAIAAYNGFREAAQSVTADDFPEVAFLEDGSIFALRLDEQLDPRPEPLDSARNKVIAARIQSETAKAMQAQANDLLTQLAADGDFTATGLPVRVENGLTRTAFLDDVPVDFMSQVFEMSPGELRVIPGPGTALIVRLDEVLPPAQTDELEQMRAALAQQLDQALAQNIFDIYVRDAQTRARPTLDERALTAVHTSYQ